MKSEMFDRPIRGWADPCVQGRSIQQLFSVAPIGLFEHLFVELGHAILD
jgi:hypothetical protein